MEDSAAGKRLLGASRDIWRSLPEVFRPRCELGVIAGSHPWGLGRMLMRLPGTNDGVVRLEETEAPGMRDRVVLPLSHSGMLVSAHVAREVAAFLERGAFDHEGRAALDASSAAAHPGARSVDAHALAAARCARAFARRMRHAQLLLPGGARADRPAAPRHSDRRGTAERCRSRADQSQAARGIAHPRVRQPRARAAG